MPKNQRLILLRGLSLFAVIALSILIFSIRDKASELAVYGYPGIFLIALMANATVLLPAPGIAIVFAMGSIFNPLGVALAAGTGGALGELSGYLAGLSGQAVIERMDLYDRIVPWVQRYGGYAILAFAAIPNPLFDLAGIAAGATKMTIGRFFLFCWIGEIIKMLLFAYAGTLSINWILNFAH
jgi:membrane protein DedA with SNARE-associated domain